MPGSSSSYFPTIYTLATDRVVVNESRDLSRLFPDIVSNLQVLANRYRASLGDDLTCVPGNGKRQAASTDEC